MWIRRLANNEEGEEQDKNCRNGLCKKAVCKNKANNAEMWKLPVL